jgi:hypothetical protein
MKMDTLKKALILVIAALALPGVALAAKPAHSGSHSAPKVTYLLKGKLSAFTPYDSTTSTNGSITIVVGASNYHGKALKGQSLTFAVDAKTAVVFHNGSTTIADGDMGLVKIRALRKIAPADLATTLQASPAKQIVDQGVKKPKH